MNNGARIFHTDWYSMATRLDCAELGKELRNLRVVCSVTKLVVYCGAVDSILPEFLLELINEVSGVGTVCRHRTLRAGTASVPDFHLPGPWSHEEHKALLDTYGIKQGHCVWLVKAGQKE